MTATIGGSGLRADPVDLTEAFRREGPNLLGFFVRRVTPPHEAADLVSETFLAAWRSPKRDDIAPEMIRPWLFGIARNVLSQHRRGGMRRSALADRARTVLSSELTAGLDGSTTVDGHDVSAYVRDLIRRLPTLDREIVTLVYWEGLSQEEVAIVIGKPAATVRSRLSRARAQLRERLEDAGA